MERKTSAHLETTTNAITNLKVIKNRKKNHDLKILLYMNVFFLRNKRFVDLTKNSSCLNNFNFCSKTQGFLLIDLGTGTKTPSVRHYTKLAWRVVGCWINDAKPYAPCSVTKTTYWDISEATESRVYYYCYLAAKWKRTLYII